MPSLRIALLGALLAARLTSAQQMTMRMSNGEVVATGPGQLLVVAARDSAVVVDGIVGDVALDVRKGDRIVALQGMRVTDLSAFLATYRAVAVGGEVTLAIERASARHVVRFDKPAPMTNATMAVTNGAGGAGAWTMNAPATGGVSILGAEISENGEGLPEVTNRKSHPLAATLPLRVGDVLTAFNGRPLASLSGLQLWLDRVKVGEQVTLTVRRGTDVLTFTFAKPAQ